MIVCTFFTVRALHRWGVRRDMRRRLVNCGVPVCPGCGYLLRGLSGDAAKCPECGMEIGNEIRGLMKRDVAASAPKQSRGTAADKSIRCEHGR